jgi:hypothetical protein
MPDKPKLESRVNEAYLYGLRNDRKDDFSAWKDRIDETDALIRGEFSVVFPNLQSSGQKPIITNLADAMPRDVARLGSEVEPSYTALAYGESEAAIENKTIRRAIGEGYFHFNSFDIIRPQLLMDQVITGGAFLIAWADYGGENEPEKGSPYPQFQRVDPRFCYPYIYNGKLIDLLVVQPVKMAVAAELWPEIKAKYRSSDDLTDVVEVWDLYTSKRCIRGVSGMKEGDTPVGPSGVTIVHDIPNPTGKPLAAMTQLPSPDGAFRGLVDQVGPSLVAKNRAVELMLEYAHEGVYSPFEAKGILNAGQPPGPTTIYQHDPTAQGDTFMRRVAPASVNLELISFIQYLDQEERGQLAYPQTRQGNISQSQGSSSFVTATQGQLTSLVRECQRGLTRLQTDIAEACFGIDEKLLNFTKPLLRSVGSKRSYNPGKDIDGKRVLFVEYGAGAGLDRNSTDVRILQYRSASLISAEKALEETDFVSSPADELNRIELEEQRRIIMQRFEGDPTVPLDVLLQVYQYQRDNGGSLVDAAVAVKALGVTMSPTTAQPPTEGAAPEAAPAEPGEEAVALEKGGMPSGAPPIPGAFTPPPLQQVFVK